MATLEAKRLAEFSRAVRESSLKRLRLVPAGFENWRPSPDAMSFADLATHLIEPDGFLFEKLESKTLERMMGEPGLVQITDRDQYLQLLDELGRVGELRGSTLEGMKARQLSERILDSRFGGEVAVWWIIVRGNLDHEIHHRGQIAAYLRAMSETHGSLRHNDS